MEHVIRLAAGIGRRSIRIGRHFGAILLLLSVVFFHTTATRAEDGVIEISGNGFPNPSFEDTELLPFKQIGKKPGEGVTVTTDAAGVHTGTRALQVKHGGDSQTYSSLKIPGEEGLYELSFWARGSDIHRFIIALNSGREWITVEPQWKRYRKLVYNTGKDLQVTLSFMQSPGADAKKPTDVFMDDFSVMKVTSGLAQVFGDRMVLQRDKKINIWGWTQNPEQKVNVELNGQQQSAVSDSEGRWKVTFNPMLAGGPYTLKLDGRDAANNVMIGDVWVCSGQSNMQMGMGLLNGIFNYSPEKFALAKHPDLRLWEPMQQTGDKPMKGYFNTQKNSTDTVWKLGTPLGVSEGSWRGFSALGFFFGKGLNEALKIPIGIVALAHGGTLAEAWISEEGLKDIPVEKLKIPVLAGELEKNPKLIRPTEFKEVPGTTAFREIVTISGKLDTSKYGCDKKSYQLTSSCYNGMISPVTDLAIKGVVWYQGESNGDMAEVAYYNKLKALIEDWRKQFKDPELPFIIVQLPNWQSMAPTEQEKMRWQRIREAQFLASQTITNVNVVVTLDLPLADIYDIHPTNKAEVGERVVKTALSSIYAKQTITGGPVYKEMTIDGDKVILSFDNAGDGLTFSGETLFGFTIAAKDGTFNKADAKIVDNTVVVSSPKVKTPAAVRYNFESYVKNPGTLANKNGFNASPFRTDDWQEK